MATRTRKKASPTTAAEPLSASVKDSAQQIWQAGLAAFTRAQAEGSKAFETLVNEGVTIQRKTQAAAEDRIADATSKMTSMANEIGSKASGQWDKLENIFEDRVARALNKLGVPAAKDVNALMARMDELTRTVQQLAAQAAPGVQAAGKKVATKKVAASKAAATKVAAKKAPVKPRAGTAAKRP